MARDGRDRVSGTLRVGARIAAKNAMAALTFC
jgi:hypothetical protein